ncbi:hypothetical protein HB364_10730 [Pseudoflavitalea sp. X16]|uniref:hypothetical protein n=1 Tax=Paraflavitalea devenefica TaxID=2716334 RepID=UPI0014232F6D|nr:hypothetical protein [Paraflavitalea devenefica]NII25559.1 hypothetical protein [Paraflavitalea devenefica]
MKAILRAYSTSLLITALSFGTQQVLAGEDPMVEKKKTYSKSYSVSSSDKISLRNQFGEMKINTWDKNEVKVDVVITAEAGTDERAQQILDIIEIQDGKGGNGVWFKTKIGNNNQHRGKGEKQSFDIDYTVYLPANNVLDAGNEFGPMTIGDYKGKVSLESKFGSLTTGNLTGYAKVQVEFGKANIGSMDNGDVTIKFSRGLINKLSGEVKANFEHSSIKVGVENDVKNLDVKNSFTQLFLDVNTGLSANFDISTSFCEVKNKTSFAIKKEGDDEDHGPKFDFRYSGKAGGGGSNVRVKTSFGDVTIGHNIAFDVNDDNKKDKKKTKSI